MSGPAPAAGAARPRTTIVVPCYDEERRLDLDAFAAFAADHPHVRFLFVDDGSTDGTRALLEKAARERPESFAVLALGANRGKAEAVRAGVLEAAVDGPELVGYWDADLSTPLDELPGMLDVFRWRPDTQLVLGSRVNLLGRQVRRRLTRHYLGRVFATFSAALLELPVYDTQCGAKVFRCQPSVVSLFTEPFHARWVFDIELLSRWIVQLRRDGDADLGDVAYEHPLHTWHDVDGSKVDPRAYLRACRDVVRIFVRHRLAGRGAGARTPSHAVARWTRAALGRLATDRTDVGRPARVARAAALVPVFGSFWVWMRLREWALGPLVVPGEVGDGLRVDCHLPDLIQSYLYLFGCWEPDVSAFIADRLQPGDVFVDVGANVGYHTLLAQRAVGPDGAVVAVEASPSVADRLVATLAANPAPAGVRVVRAAAADRTGTLTMFRGPSQNVGLSTPVAERGFEPECEVPCAPLGDLVEGGELARARIVKIDVEGAEPDVLRGMLPALDRLPPDAEIVLELSPKWWSDPDLTPREVLEPFFAAGWHLYVVDNSLWPWRCLWPRAVRRPRRVAVDLTARPKRIDAVLSRIDAPSL